MTGGCIDISDELVEIIEQSWAREELIPPYHIYIKMAYHLSNEARTGLNEFRIPSDFEGVMFEFQTAAVKIAAHHLNRRGGVLIGDVVGLGKTLMGTALARIFEDDYDLETLIICPKNLVKMWEDYRDEYRLRARVLSSSRVISDLPDLRRYRLVLIDESHNLRNREGKRYGAIQEYIEENESRVILLSATPYNKTYLDLSNQLRLFVDENEDLGIRPEQLLRALGGETAFVREHQSGPRTLAAFEHSEYIDDWRELMRLYLVRRTRSFIMEHYAETESETGRRFLILSDGTPSYFPTRIPKTVKFTINDQNPDDPYAQLYSPRVVDTISNLKLPRYGLANYIDQTPSQPPTDSEQQQLENLSRGGKRLIGFSRTNLFKRLESSGQVFIQSVERHILRNYIYLYAIENDKPLPIGTQNAEMLDSRINDEDVDIPSFTSDPFDDDTEEQVDATSSQLVSYTADMFKEEAAEIYHLYTTQYKSRFRWIRPDLFRQSLWKDLNDDAHDLLEILQRYGTWTPEKDAKLNALENLLTQCPPDDKVLIFTQFADTVRYLNDALSARGLTQIAAVTGDSPDPTALAWRFSPLSNNRQNRQNELRVLISTDILSEGQNLQDCSIVVNYDLPWAIIRLVQRAGRVDRIGQEADVVNYDLPWAIIRLVQRAGRVDRIGQEAENILCYSFLPAEGVERIINLRARVQARLHESEEVIGTDEAFFEDDDDKQVIVDLYNERAGLLDDESDNDVDLASYAYQIWKDAITEDPHLEGIISELPSVVYSTQPHSPTEEKPEGALVYVRTGEGNDALAWVNRDGESVTESQFAILQAAECKSDTPALSPLEEHHQLVKRGTELIVAEERSVGGGLGRPSGARFRTYERLTQYAEEVQEMLFNTQELRRAIEDIYRYPLRQSATDALNRQLRSNISDQALAELVIDLRNEDRLCIVQEEEQVREPQIICSLGLAVKGEEDTDAN